MPNRLQFSKSPYLLQHANNPVDWHEWNAEAFALARRTNKLVFLSIGYSACHWCHVMAHECFESSRIANALNESFVSIKVDREERPDVDAIYMRFVMSISGHGGWPLSAFLTPDGEPIFGGTYFPPAGFLVLLDKLSTLWDEDRQRCLQSAGSISEQLRELGQRGFGAQRDSVPSPNVATKAVQQLRREYDEADGGFGSAPKFPSVANTHYLIHRFVAWASATATEESSSTPPLADASEMLRQSVTTLLRIGRGGIADHLGGGISRYSVDDEWRVPHFEKMLYDQGQLLSAYAEAIKMLRCSPTALLPTSFNTLDVIQELEGIATGIVRYLATDLADSQGGFYAAEDADSFPSVDDKSTKEGAYYVWEQQELIRVIEESALAEDAVEAVHLLRARYGLRADGNIPPTSDPHGELVGQNILHSAETLQETASAIEMPLDRARHLLATSHKALFEARKHRPRPHLDDKIVSGWNFLAVSGLCQAAEALPAPYNKQALSLAERATEFVLDKLWDSDSAILHRSFRRGAGPQGVSADYAFAVSALLDLYESTLDTRHLSRADELQTRMDELFWDDSASGGGGYFIASSSVRADDGPVLARLKDEQDNAEPSANSVTAGSLRRLLHYFPTHQSAERKKRLETLLSTGILVQNPRAVGALAAALIGYAMGVVDVVIVGRRESQDVQTFLDRVRARFLPTRSLILVDTTDEGSLEAVRTGPLGEHEVVKGLLQGIEVGGATKAYVCKGFQCGLPISEVEELEKALNSI